MVHAGIGDRLTQVFMQMAQLSDQHRAVGRLPVAHRLGEVVRQRGKEQDGPIVALDVFTRGDFCSGIVWGLQRDASGKWQNRKLFETGLNISSFGEDQSGELYLLDLRGGVYKLE